MKIVYNSAYVQTETLNFIFAGKPYCAFIYQKQFYIFAHYSNTLKPQHRPQTWVHFWKANET